MRTRGLLIGICVTVIMAAGTLALATSPHPSIPWRIGSLLRHTAEPDPTAWPSPAASLRELEAPIPSSSRPLRVFVDPGHGAKDNTGNVSAYCRDEQDFTLALAEELATYLRQSGPFEVKLSRRGDKLVAYPERVRTADAWRAHVFISLHSDVRGTSSPWSPVAGRTCLRSEQAPGFSVLWSDEPKDAERRLALARSVARSMTQAGFVAYDGAEYRNLYEADEAHAGVFVDRHAPSKRIYVLHKPSMPSLIVETHNALDTREANRWEEARTRRAFFASIRAALVRYGAGSGG